MKNVNVLSEVYNKLDKALNYFNKEVFKGEFESIVFTIQGEKATAKGSYGTQWAEKWQVEDKKVTEISLSAEHLQLGNINRLFITLIHELVHERAYKRKIKDTSRNGRFHNKRFVELAEEVGLICQQNKQCGCVTETAHEWLTKIFNECYAFIGGEELTKNLLRLPTTSKPKTSTNLIKYVCPICGAIARAKANAHIVCGDCEERMQEE